MKNLKNSGVCQKWEVLVVSLVAIFAMSTTVNSQEGLSITLDCAGTCNNREINYTNDITLQLTIENSLGKWIEIPRSDGNIGGGTLNLEIENGNPQLKQKYLMYQEVLGKGILLPPGETKIFIPFSDYNKLDPDSRIYVWTIHPTLSLYANVYCYEDPQHISIDSRRACIMDTSHGIKGNTLKFETVKPETQTNTSISQSEQGTNSTLKSLWEFCNKYPLVYLILVPIIIAILKKKKVI